MNRDWLGGGLLALVAWTAHADSLLVERVSVITMTESGVLADQDVLLRDRLVASIGPHGQVEAADDVRRLDGGGGFLIPGLAEMHAHLGPWPGDATEKSLDLFVANGVTTVRSMLGHPSHLKLRQAQDDGAIVAPRIIASGPSFNGGSVHSPSGARARVAAQAGAGYDFLKLHPGLTREEFTALADEARRQRIPFAGHVSSDVGLELALGEGMATIDHLDGYMQALVTEPDPERAGFFAVGMADDADPGGIDELARRTAAAGVWNVPTQTLIENLIGPASLGELAARDEYEFVSSDQLDEWLDGVRESRDSSPLEVRNRAVEIRRRLIAALQREGAGVLLGSDAPQFLNVPGFSLHRELGIYVEAGLTPFQALASGTRNVGRFLGEADTTGVVAPGARADLVLLNSNPLDDIAATRDIRAVCVAGRCLDRLALDRLLARHSDER